MKNSLFIKISSAFLVVMLALAMLPVKNAFAAVTRTADWASVGSSVGNGTTLSTSGSYAAVAGTERYTLLAVTVVNTGATVTSTVSGTWGGVAFNSNTPTRFIGQVGNTTGRRVIYLFGFNEADIAARINDTIAINSSLNSAATYMHSYMSTYAGVNQTTPTTFSSVDNGGGTTTTAQYAAALNTVNGSYGASILLVGGVTGGVGVTNTDAAASPNTAYAMSVNNIQVGAASGTYATLGNKAFTGTGTTRPTFTFSNNRNVLIGVVLAPSLPNTTTAGTATATAASPTSISVSMPYTDDGNTNNTYTVDYKLSSAVGWTNWVTNAAHTASPYTTTITGLSAATSYDVRVTYNDVNGVTGTNPQTISNVTTQTSTFDTSVRFTGNGNPLTQSYTVGSGGDLLVVSIVTGGNTARTGGAPTYNGIALTQADANRTANETVTEMWYLTNPPNGAAYNISIPNNGGLNLYATASSYFAQSGYTFALDVANGNTNGNSANPSVSVTTTANGDVIVGAMGNGGNTAPTGRSGTMLYENDNGLFSDSSQYFYQTTAGAYATSWTIGADDWGVVVAAFKQTILPNTTTVGTATAIAASSTTINVSMPYTDDGNLNNTYTVDYKLSSAGGWTNWVTNAAHTSSPYTTTITGLLPSSDYDVRVTYNDADGITGTNPQTISNITTPAIPISGSWTNVYSGTGTTVVNAVSAASTSTCTAGAGSNRVVLVAFSASAATGFNSNFSMTVPTATFGGVSVTEITSTKASTDLRPHAWIGYIKEANIPAGAQNISITFTKGGTNNSAIGNISIFCATFTNVDQTSVYSHAAVGPNAAFQPASPTISMNVGVNDQAILFTPNSANATVNNYTPTSYTAALYFANAGYSVDIAHRTIPATAVTGENTSVTWSANGRSSILGVTLKRAPDKLDQIITVGTAAPANAVFGTTFPVDATSDSGLNVAITTSGGCSGSGTSSAVITMTSGTTACVVHYNQAGDTTYNAAPEVTSSTTAQKATATITFNAAPTPTYLGGNFTVSASTNNTDSSTLTYSYVSGPCAFVSGATFSSSGAGTCVVQANGAATANFNAASQTQSVSIAKATATITLGSLAQTYDGTPKPATATTTPNGLTVDFTYNGSPTAPTNAGSYTVVGTINDVNYVGTSTDTLVISKATATVTLGSLAQTYNGTPKSATAATTPNGLTVDFTYNGSPTAPTNAGSYTVVGTINDVNYAESSTDTLVISKATATVTLGSLAQTYDGTPKSATATTTPNGLTVDFTYNGSPTAPTNAGSYTVIGTINDVNYAGSSTDTLVISKAAATATLGSLAQTYDGTPKSATATTTPNGLTVDFTYNGSPTTPINAGSYTVVGTVNDPNYAGSSTDTLVISKATATVTLGSLAQTYDGTPKSATATTTPNGLTVDFTYNGSPTPPTNAGSYTVVGTVNDPNYAGSSTDTLVISKAAATATLGSLAQTYDGTPKSATATTTPNGLTVDFTYNGSPTTPINAGSYTVVGTVNDPNYAGSSTDTLVISKATATVTLGSLAQTYDGTPKSATATTTPNGLTVDFTYNGSPTPPTNAGSYTVIGTVNDANYVGTSTDTLVIAKANQNISFTTPAPVGALVGGPVYTPSASSTSGLSIIITIDAASAAVCSISGGDVSYFGTGTCTINANQAGDSNYNPALQAQQSFGVGLGNQTITMTSTAPAAAVVSGPVYTPSATGGPSGNPVVFTIDASAASVCSISSGDVSFQAVGTCVVNANQAGSSTYAAASQVQQSFVVGKGTPIVSWSNPADITYGTPLSAIQLNATASVPGTFTYNPVLNSVLGTGAGQVLSVDFTPTDSANYLNVNGTTVTINVLKANPTLSVTNSPVVYNGSQQAAVVVGSVSGTVSNILYNGSINQPKNPGTYLITADFAPTDSVNYNNLTAASAGDFIINSKDPDYPTFADVPMNHWAWAYVESIYAAGITAGCGTNPLIYCPDEPITRAQMAIFILRGVHGKTYVPPVASGTVFTDVPTDYWAADWIEQLAEEGITVGCGDGNYCPENAITRAEMSIFLLRSKLGNTHTPPPATGTTFNDVPADHWAASWIEQLALMEITSGCGNGAFCPEGQVTRDQMAVFIQRMFEFPLP